MANYIAPILRASDINFNNIELGDLNSSGVQPLAYISFNHNDQLIKLLLQTGSIQFMANDLLNPEIITDSGYMIVCFDRNQPSCIELKKHFEKADAYFGSAEIKANLFGNDANTYEYVPIIKTQDNPFNNVQQYDYCKFKLNMFDTNNGKIIKTKLRTKSTGLINVETIAEIKNNVIPQSIGKLIIYYNNIYVNNNHIGEIKKFGISLKVMAIELQDNNTSIIINNIVSENNNDTSKNKFSKDMIKSVYKKYKDEEKELNNKKISIDI